jgi:hypothetical protein
MIKKLHCSTTNRPRHLHFPQCDSFTISVKWVNLNYPSPIDRLLHSPDLPTQTLHSSPSMPASTSPPVLTTGVQRSPCCALRCVLSCLCRHCRGHEDSGKCRERRQRHCAQPAGPLCWECTRTCRRCWLFFGYSFALAPSPYSSSDALCATTVRFGRDGTGGPLLLPLCLCTDMYRWQIQRNGERPLHTVPSRQVQLSGRIGVQ